MFVSSSLPAVLLNKTDELEALGSCTSSRRGVVQRDDWEHVIGRVAHVARKIACESEKCFSIFGFVNHHDHAT